MHGMLSQLRSRGFATVSLKPWIRDALQSATLNDASTMDSFRFPPIEGPILYTNTRRLAFRALFEVATSCFSNLLQNDAIDQNDAVYKLYTSAIRQVRDDNNVRDSFRLFTNEHEPFEPGQPFSQTFFNLFNYDHGSLNSHVDRSLITVIYSAMPLNNVSSTFEDNNLQQSALWIKDNNDVWHNADEAITPNEAIIMVGEDLIEAGSGVIASNLDVFAAEHAVRVDPLGERIERSHFRKDPTCSDNVRNRVSAAMILRHELE